MDKARWQYLKQLQQHPGRMVHCSDPPLIEVSYPTKDGRGTETKMVRADKGVTFCENRSARKRASREAKAGAA